MTTVAHLMTLHADSIAPDAALAELELPSANGNRARFRAQWWANDGNPFYEDRSSSLLLGVEVSASLDTDKLYDARENRPTGWLPLVWGQYDLGYGGERSIQRTELTAEFHDSELFDQLLTGILTYESRQEYRPGDYDNISYTVSIGAQARVGLASVFSQGQPLVVGVEYLHRSAHVLAPDADRVPADETLPHNSINLGPRLFGEVHRGFGSRLRLAVSAGSRFDESVAADFYRLVVPLPDWPHSAQVCAREQPARLLSGCWTDGQGNPP